tara:strand:- start:6139 stop:7512 length:1374 start_codon:yes stop_codon:yes gene_type:complete
MNQGSNVVIERISRSDLDDATVRFDQNPGIGGRGGTFENGRVRFERMQGAHLGESAAVVWPLWGKLSGDLASVRAVAAFAAAFVLAMVLLFVGVFYYVVPSSSVVISPRVQNIPVDVGVRIDPDAGAVDIDRGIVPALITEVEVSESLTKPTTGRRREPSSHAEGLVTLRNRTDQALELPMGSRVTSVDGVVFLTKAPLLVPATLKVGATSIPGEASVVVRADLPGLSGNAPPLSITQVSGDLGAKLEVFNPQAFRGGDEREVFLVTQRDMDELSSVLLERLQSAAIERLRRQRETHQDLVVWSPAAGNPQILEESFSALIDDRTGELTLTMAIRAQATMFSVADAKAVIRDRIMSNPDHQYFDVDLVDIRGHKVLAENQGLMDVQFAAVGQVIDDIDTDRARALITGQRLGEGMEALRAMPGVRDVSVVHHPPETQNFPRLGFRVGVTIKSDRSDQ